MKKILLVLAFLIPTGNLQSQHIIPRPSNLVGNTATLRITPETKIRYSAGLEEIASYLSGEIQDWTRMTLQTEEDRAFGRGDVNIRLRKGDKVASGSYTLRVNDLGVDLIANDSAGVFNGVQSLLQLISNSRPYLFRGAFIVDSPRYYWRGLMLDSSRHFQRVEEVKEFIDLMAHYKFNKFHWHLTDDQGWRIEIKSLPNLTKLGAWRVPREGIWWFRPGPIKGEKATYGGFYTQDEIREVVEYARRRFIEVIPEIDVPGHSLATLTAYPNLGTTDGPFKVNPGSKFYNEIENTLDPSNEESFEFLDKVFKEVAELFPSKYIHVGGDEATTKFWAESRKVKSFMAAEKIANVEVLQSYFIKRVEKILEKYEKRLIGWDEILLGGLAETATVMSWRGKEGGIQAARMGRDVIMSPAPEYYLDVLQGDPSIEPATYSMSRLKDTYSFDPTLPVGVDSTKLLGLQGNLWTEEVPNQRHAQYMTWPRAFAIAEAAWSKNLDKDWPEFVDRVEAHFTRFDKMDVNYSKAIYDPSLFITTTKDGKKKISMMTELDDLSIHYTFDDAEPDHHYPKYTGSVEVPIGAYAIRMQTYRGGKSVGRTSYSEIHRIGKGKRTPMIGL